MFEREIQKLLRGDARRRALCVKKQILDIRRGRRRRGADTG